MNPSQVNCGRYLKIDPHAWPGIEKTAEAADAKHHIGPVRVFNFQILTPSM